MSDGPITEQAEGTWVEWALEIALSKPSIPRILTDEGLENLAQCALGPTRGDDRLAHLEHVAGTDVPRLIQEIVRQRRVIQLGVKP